MSILIALVPISLGSVGIVTTKAGGAAAQGRAGELSRLEVEGGDGSQVGEVSA